jgi:gamma-glutamyltranspeptidase
MARLTEFHHQQRPSTKLEREEGDLRREINHLKGSTHKWRRRKIPWGRVTMINGAMSSTLMG